MTIYFNMRTNQGIETVDELSRKDFKNAKEYCKERKSMKDNYRLAGMNVYISSRSTKDWRKRD